ncbi:MAG: serine hydrolase [Bacteroidales bacterium]|nr:serine hydrolase [Bacteroidales bacterium]
MKKLLKRTLYVVLLGILVFAIVYAWPRVPIITVFTAKGMCSSVFIADKDPERVYTEDLSFFPISLAKAKVNYEERSVTATVFGIARRKAVFREGLGAVIVLETPEEELRAASFDIPDPGYSQDTIPWPKGDVLPESLPEGVNYTRLDAILSDAFDPPGAEPLRKTLGVAVVYDNVLIAEKYLEGYDAYTEFHGWSMTKSLTGAMVGILAGEGRVDVKAAVDIPEWKNDERGETTLENLLQMNSGLKWVENYFTISEATIMLMQSDDMYEYTIGIPSEHTPGSSWRYSSGDANLVSGLIRRAVGNNEQYHQLPYTGLMHRIGMLNTLIETDAAGNFVSSSYCYGTTRDWARFGLLFLNDGVFAGDTILPPGWVDYSRQEAPNSDGNYAGTFWLQEPNPLNQLKDVPDDIFFADGFLGQRIYIIPSKKLVVVRMGYSLKNFSVNNFLKDIISTLPD